ncbi:probable protein phosphatase 2C 21, partial [Lolium perenne]|uniref:probable protein phosphatase 2C 21 n=1 Tax=Lolium perenne TaxID=4522 RepID=UPI003A99E2C8
LSCLQTPACVQGAPKFEGSTACVALIRGYEIIVGNVSDSRCVLSRNGQAIDLSTDHRPNLPEELQRIENAGRQVIKDGVYFRCSGQAGVPKGGYPVNGMLPMSRAIGDFYFKSNETLLATEQAVTCNPDVRTEAITHDTDFLLIASDGIWDFVSSQEAVDFVQEKFAGGTSDLCTICEELLDHCYSSKGNSTVILVQFRHAARLPHPAPDLPVAHPTDGGGSSNPSSSAGITQDTGADAKATTDTNAENKEDVYPSWLHQLRELLGWEGCSAICFPILRRRSRCDATV